MDSHRWAGVLAAAMQPDKVWARMQRRGGG